MQFSRVFPPHVSSAVFLAGRVTHRKKHWHTMLSLPEHKRETFQPGVWASETNRRLAHHHGEKERWALRWFVLWMKSLQAEMLFFFFVPTSLFLRKPLWSFLDEKVPRLLRTFLGKKRWMLEMESWCGHYESLPFITSETISRALSFLQISAALSWESLSLLDSSFRIMQRWEMGRLWERGLCTHACGNVHACDRRCLLWLKLFAFGIQNTSGKTGIVIFIAC